MIQRRSRFWIGTSAIIFVGWGIGAFGAIKFTQSAREEAMPEAAPIIPFGYPRHEPVPPLPYDGRCPPEASPKVVRIMRYDDPQLKKTAPKPAPGTRYDDPWLRAMIMTPSISDMTATLYGRPDIGELRNLMRKPRASLMLAFRADPCTGPLPDNFRGEAVMFLNNYPLDSPGRP